MGCGTQLAEKRVPDDVVNEFRNAFGALSSRAFSHPVLIPVTRLPNDGY